MLNSRTRARVILIFCVGFAALIFARDVWIAPYRASLSRDMAYAAGIILVVGLYHWVAARWSHYKSVNSLAGVIGYGCLGFASWASGNRLIAVMLAVLCGWEAYDLINGIARQRTIATK
jgi:hypothetical protein